MVSLQLIFSVLLFSIFMYFNESYLTCMTHCHGSLARILYTLFYLKILFFKHLLGHENQKPKLNWYNEDNSSWHRFSIVTLWDVSHVLFIREQGAKKVIFTACHSGKLNLTFTSPNIISTSTKNVLMSRLISQFSCILNSSKNFTCPSGKLITEFTSPIAKSTSPGLSDTTFFARWGGWFVEDDALI